MHEGSGQRHDAERDCAPGPVLNGRYLIERVLSRGAMSIVVAGRRVSRREPVAIKYLNPEQARDPVACARFDREVTALWKSQSEHVVRLLDVGNAPPIGPFMVMEWLDGDDLARRLEQGPLGAPLATGYVLQACKALAVTHGAGIVHHDVKPENLLLSRGEGEEAQEGVKLIDFGISEEAARTERPSGDWIVGTPAYMSPERITGSDLQDQRSDIWSLGVTLHELCTGQLPFSAPSDIELCRAIASGQPPELVADTRVLPRATRRVVWRCLRPDPAERYQHVEQVLEALSEPAPSSPDLRGHVTGTFERSLLARCSAHLRRRVRARRR